MSFDFFLSSNDCGGDFILYRKILILVPLLPMLGLCMWAGNQLGVVIQSFYTNQKTSRPYVTDGE